MPPFLATEIFSSFQRSVTAGHLGAYEIVDKMRQRFLWPGTERHVGHHNRLCEKCLKCFTPTQKQRHSLIDWKMSYPFHHIGFDSLGSLTTSNGCRYKFLIEDHLTKWYKAIPLPDQTAAKTSQLLPKR